MPCMMREPKHSPDEDFVAFLITCTVVILTIWFFWQAFIDALEYSMW